jgi:hypothetical protein
MTDEPTIADFVSKAESDKAREKAAEAVRLSVGDAPKRRGRPPKNPTPTTATKTAKPTPHVDKAELHDFVDTVRLRQQQYTLKALAKLGHRPEEIFVDPSKIATSRPDSNIKPEFQQFFASEDDVDYVTEKLTKVGESEVIAKWQDSKLYKVLMAISAISDLAGPALNTVKYQMQMARAMKADEEAGVQGQQPQQPPQPQEQPPMMGRPFEG